MLQKVIYILFLSILNLHFLSATYFNCNPVSESALLINAKTGKVLFAKNENKLHYPASLTKIATGIYSLHIFSNDHNTLMYVYPDLLRSMPSREKQKLNYKHPPHLLEEGASKVGIMQHEKLRFTDLIHALLISSAGDAANVLAYHLGDNSVDNFMTGMNKFVRSIGCTSTNFVNPHGLFHPKQVTTCTDMAKLCCYAMKNEMFRKIVRTARYEQPATNLQPQKYYVQSNKLLKEKNALYYPYAIGIKTGYVAKAQHTFVGAAEKDDRILIAVLLRCPNRDTIFKDAKTLFETAFSEKKESEVLIQSGAQSLQRVVRGGDRPLTTYTKTALTTSYYPSEKPTLKTLLFWDELKLPIRADSKVGEIQLIKDNELVDRVDIYAQEDIDSNLSSWIKDEFLSLFGSKGLTFYIVVAAFILIVVAIFLVVLH